MKLQQLRNAVAVAERGSLHAAARHLKITQPALTRSIRELENELGTPLFERHSRGIALTEPGALFIARARAALGEVDRARDEIRQQQGVLQGRVSACLGVLPHLFLLPHTLQGFRERYPEVGLEIIEGRFPSIEASLKSGVVDLFVGPAHGEAGKEFAVEPLYEQEVAILCRHGHALGDARSLRQLAHAEWLTNSVTADPANELGPLFARHGLPPPRSIVQSHSGLTILTVIAHSDLLVLLPADITRSELGSALLRRIPVAEKIPALPIAMIRRAGLPLTPAAEYFADMVRRASVEFRRVRTRSERR
jgi:LysR family transcriptional regulator, regulator of abg operon